MNKRNLLLVLLGSALWSCSLNADDYPASYIAQQLVDTKKPVEVKVTNMEPGLLMMVSYVGRPIWIYRRTARDIEYLSENNTSYLADPESKNLMSSIRASYASSASYVWTRLLLVDHSESKKLPYRSKNVEYFVVGGWGPDSGCTLRFASPEKRNNEGVAFYDPCAGALFDVAGRVLKGQLTGKAAGLPARYNLYIPPYWFKNDETLIVGIHGSKSLPELQVSKERRYLSMTPTEKLFAASRYDDLEIVKLALKEGADAGCYSAEKGSPLDAAIIGSSMEVINLLIANGAKPTQHSLNAASFVGRTEVIKLIKEMQ